jgi:hypothetical protein
VATDGREVTSLGEEPNVETVTGERLYERSSSAVLDRGESQIASFIQPTVA